MESVFEYFEARLWPDELPKRTALARLLPVARFAFALLRDLATGELNLRAMSLVYTTMLSIAPMLAFAFAIAKGLGLHRQLEPLLQRFLEPIGPGANEVAANVVGFVDNVSGPVLVGTSVGIFLFTALSMAQKVEGSLNFVWRVDRPRSLGRRFSEYLSIMFVGPLIMVVAMSLIAAFSSSALVERLREIGPLGASIAALSNMMPYLLVIAAFGFLYLVIPNAKVRIGPALAGGLFAGLTWVAGGELFTQFVVATSRYQAIYSGFAILFLLMLWMYLSWLILLLGAQLAFYLQHPEYLRLGQRTETTANELRERLALNAMLLIARDFDESGHGWRLESLAARLRVPRHLLEPIMVTLTNADLVTQTAEQRLLPARGLRRIKIADVLAAVRQPHASSKPRDWNDTVDSLAQRIDAAIGEVLAGQTLADLVDSDVKAERAESV